MPEWLQPPSLVLIGAVAASLSILLIWFIGFAPRRQPRRVIVAILRQFAGAAASIVLSLLLVVMVLNRGELWYPTWASLMGAPSVTAISRHGGPLPVATPERTRLKNYSEFQRNPQQNPEFSGQTWGDDGAYLKFSLTGKASGLTGQVMVWLPASYLKEPERGYPVITMLTGVPGSVDVYRKKLDVGRVLAEQVADHRIRESIVIVPETNFHGIDTECVDSKNGHYKVESFVTIDVVNWAKTHLRTIDHRDAWATFGYSAGGWCATMLTMRHPEQFRFAMNMSGYFTPLFPNNGRLPLANPSSYDLAEVARTSAPPVAIWFWSARDDTFSMKAIKEFTPAVKPPTTLVTTFLDSGGHSWPVWHHGLTAGLTWLGQHSPHFAWVET